MTAFPIVAVSAIALLVYLTLRRVWILSVVEEYALTASYYALRTKQSDQVRTEMSQMWPVERIVWDPFHWTLRPYLVHQDHYDAMESFIASELAREDLDWHSLTGSNDDTDTDPDSSP